MQNLTLKQDAMHSTIAGMQTTVSDHARQIDRLTQAHKDRAALHESTLVRLQALETEVQYLRASSRSVFPALLLFPNNFGFRVFCPFELQSRSGRPMQQVPEQDSGEVPVPEQGSGEVAARLRRGFGSRFRSKVPTSFRRVLPEPERGSGEAPEQLPERGPEQFQQGCRARVRRGSGARIQRCFGARFWNSREAPERAPRAIPKRFWSELPEQKSAEVLEPGSGDGAALQPGGFGARFRKGSGALERFRSKDPEPCSTGFRRGSGVAPERVPERFRERFKKVSERFWIGSGPRGGEPLRNLVCNLAPELHGNRARPCPETLRKPRPETAPEPRRTCSLRSLRSGSGARFCGERNSGAR